MTPVQLVSRLRQQARAMKAGPDSLLVQAANTIEAQERALVEKEKQLLLAARVIASSIAPRSEGVRQP